MRDVIMSLDPGESLTKVVYQVVGERKSNLLAMHPEVIVVAKSSIENYISARLGNPRPEAEAYGTLSDGKCFIVGNLAREFLATSSMKELKYERAVYKVLAAIGVVAASSDLPNRFGVALAVLLPWNEYPDRERFEKLLYVSLKNYTFRGSKLRVKLEHFECKPEGSGLAMARIGEKGLDWFRSRPIVTLMFGHRNTSALVFDSGKLSQIHSGTTELGFHVLVDSVMRRTSGQNTDKLTKAIFSLGNAANALESPVLRNLVRATSAEQREAEITQIANAIAAAREEYWVRLCAWLSSLTAFRELNCADAIIAGGGAHYFKRELQSWCDERIVRTYWGDELMQQMMTTLFRDVDGVSALAFRLVDGFGLFKHLLQLSPEAGVAV